MMWIRVAAAIIAASALQTTSFRAETRLVVLHTTVKNSHGELVTDLDRGAFTVYENGTRQPLTLFRRDDIPVSVGLLIDNSGSMRLLRAKVEAAALAFARASNPDDEMFVLNFADTPRIDVPFTSDRRVLEAGIARVDAIGGTAMRDAVEMADTYLLEHATRDRKALLIVTDGNDNASVTSLDRIVERAEQHDVGIYAIGLFRDGDPARNAHHELDRLAARSGGSASYPAAIETINALALDLARQIRHQYTLAYVPQNQALDGSYRKIRVTVAGSGFTVRARQGYRASPVAEEKPPTD